MDLGIAGKVALVAASSKGLGKAVALGLAREGARVTICARGEEALQRAAAEIRADTGAEVFPVVADVSRSEEIKRLVQATLERFGRIDILVNNAGGPPAGTFFTLSEADWEQGLALNLFSTIRLCQEVIPIMRRQQWGRIINITSITAKQPIETLVISNVIRSGVLGLAKTLSHELARENILVNSVCPGYILTERMYEVAQRQAAEKGITPEAAIQENARAVPMGRVGQPEEFANLVVFLASERASYITGTAIQIDGGLYRGLF
ncbi:MAG: SDR family oxidoreductase [Nitrospinota bacterium]|nr:MAG: SDR family oxidoreductase [Nitrospinota bacterium]